MMTALTCFDYEQKGTIDRYVTGRSGTAETEEFELHLIGCANCQAAVRVGAASRAALRSQPSERAQPRRSLAPWLALALAAGVAAIVVGAYWLQRPGDLEALGRVAVAPAYQGMAMRSSTGAADSLFEQGMMLYTDARYAEAREVLSRAIAAGADSIPASFFIGSVHVMDGDPRRALSALRAVMGRGETPYTGEAHYYAAKAFLQLGQRDSAVAHLRAAAASPLAVGAQSRALADSIAEVQR